MASSLADQIECCGYGFLPAYLADTDTVAVATALGTPLVPWEGGLVQQLTPRATATPNTYSGIYGLDRFPFHTDLAHWRNPPRYLLLRCINGYADVPTLLIDAKAIFEGAKLNSMTRAIVKPRRPQNGSVPLLRLCEQVGAKHRFRWDEVFLVAASRTGETAIDAVKTFLSSAEPLSIALHGAGDTLIIDNWRMLHARSPIVAGREDRAIERIYLERLH
jgi:L-asparagine oxygenase